MRLVSLNTGLPRDVTWHGRTVTTGIYKEPVDGRVAVRRLNLDGDRQADLSVHGGKDKAVYCYPIEHYEFWRNTLSGQDVPLAAFGENFTTEGMLEASTCIGDELAVGSARFVVTQPRLPCYKLGVRFQSDAMVKRFLASGRSGFYLAVTQEGSVTAGDVISAIGRDAHRVAISEITRLYVAKRYDDEDVAAVRRALQVTALPEGWKTYFHERLERIGFR
jgi:MOSC domain-containing protein YiiM